MPSPLMSLEFENILLGKRISWGSTRTVYYCNLNPDWVVKIEDGACDFQNVNEWGAWQHAEPRLKKWLAPCLHISSSGSILIMQKANPIRANELPRKVPEFFNDMKAENWGIIDGRPVCVDYGLQRRSGYSQLKLTGADWD